MFAKIANYAVENKDQLDDSTSFATHKTIYYVWNSILVLDTITQFVYTSTGVYDYGAILPPVAILMGTTVSLLFLYQAILKQDDGDKIFTVVFMNIVYFLLTLIAIFIDIILSFAKPTLFQTCSVDVLGVTTDDCTSTLSQVHLFWVMYAVGAFIWLYCIKRSVFFAYQVKFLGGGLKELLTTAVNDA